MEVNFGAQISSTNPATYGMVGVAASGALNLAPTADQGGPGERFGLTPFNLDLNSRVQAVKMFLLPAGTTTLSLQSFRANTTVVPNCDYASMVITPMSWVGAPSPGQDMTRGTTAQRDAVYGVPATDAQRAALANQVVTWHNTTTGRSETYYATTGTAGLVARGLLAGNASGWYPVAGSQLICTRIKNNGFQNIGGGVPTAPTLLAPTVNIGGFTTSDSRDIITPIGGYYDVSAAIYYSGHGAISYANCIVEQVGVVELVANRMNSLASATDAQPTVSALALPATTGFRFGLAAVAAGATNIYGDGVRRLTYLTVSYAGPPLVNG